MKVRRRNLSTTGIEYGEFNWNFYPGCLHKPQGECPVERCWAEAMAKRQKWDFHQPHLIPERLLDPLKRKKPALILVNFMGDLFGDWVDRTTLIPIWVDDYGTLCEQVDTMQLRLQSVIRRVCEECPQHTFLFLTKAPENIWSVEWPDNCWMGATCWDDKSYGHAIEALSGVNAKHKWLSIEPLLGEIQLAPVPRSGLEGVSWLVIGAQTRPDVMPKIEWVKELVEACDAAGVKVWLKDNLLPLLVATEADWAFDYMGNLRQELP